MRFLYSAIVMLVLFGCDETRVYEVNQDFDEQYWLVQEQPVFEFTIENEKEPYNLYCNLRNSVSYPYSRIFLNYTLKDSTGAVLKKELKNSFLFDRKTGQPQGVSGLGDIYDHQLDLLKNFSFEKPGKYAIQFEQFMRTDTLRGVLAIGVRVERVTNSK
jgi:gliding motility-associated lipoprotein GldH